MKERRIKTARHMRRRRRVRKKISGTPDCPRMSVCRSLRHITVQLVDDMSGRTLCALSTRSKDVRGEIDYGGNVAAAARIGKAIAEKARALGIERVCFDRGGRKYHGRIKALADAAREGGLKF